jgi:DNA-binding winged helix-turn-helix (wHTH) protein/tetratricopeptide (TPR) repeat protein
MEHGLIRFEGFELDPGTRTLKRDGQAVAIKPKTFDLLLYLAQHPHKVVSKDELLASVWPNSFVDESNLSQHVFLLRKALAAGGQGEGVVTTVPGKGYQFTAAVEVVNMESRHGDEGRVVVHAVQSITRLVVEEDEDAGVLAPAGNLQGVKQGTKLLAGGWARRRKAALAWGAAGAVVLLGLGAWFGWTRMHARAGSHVQAVIADFENSTGDATFDHTLNKVVQIDLQQSPYFTVIGEGRLRTALGLMGRKPGAAITGEDVREACRRLNAQVYLTPAIAAIGSRYLVTMSANACADGSTVGARKEEADSKSGVLRAVEEATSGIRKDVGESRASIKQFDKPLYLEKTSSLEALQAYSEATRQGGAGKFDDAARLYEQAIGLDPNFAIAYADVSSMYFNMGDSDKARQNISTAYGMRDTVNARERLYITYRYHESVTGDLHAMRDTLQLWADTYPEDNLVMANLANHLTWIGQYRESAQAAEKSIQMNTAIGAPLNGIGLEIAARAFKHLGEYDKALEYYRMAVEHKVDSPGIHAIALQIAALRHDQKEVERQIEWSRGTSAEAQTLQGAGMAALADGHARDSERLFAQATAAARRDHVEADMAVIDAYRTRILAEMGLTARAKELMDAFTASDTYMDQLYAMAELGDGGRAKAIALERQKAAPQDTLLNVEYVPSVLAALELRAGKASDAVEQLRAAEAYELRDPTIAYLRGQAYLAANRPAEAEGQFRLLIENPGIDDPLTPLHALAHLNLARALAKQGKADDAHGEYGQCLAMWKTADEDLPALKEAKAELAQLTR